MVQKQKGHLVIKRIKYLLGFIITFYSCSLYKQISTEKDDYLILNVVQIKEDVQIQNKAFVNNNSLIYFSLYKELFLDEKKISNLGISFNGKVEWIFNDKDIKYMRKKYKKWIHRTWDNSIVSNLGNDIITYPFYDKTYKKAMVIVSETNKHTKILLLKKTNNTWVIVGSLSSGIVH